MENQEKPLVSIIVAMAPNHAIGYLNALPWHIDDDLKRFKALTMGHTIIMGRHTFESLPHGALPGRRNIVVSRSTHSLPGCTVCTSLADALRRAGSGEVFVIGGEQIYQQALPLADRLYITLVDHNPPHADAWFPDYAPQQWRVLEREPHNGYTFLTLSKR